MKMNLFFNQTPRISFAIQFFMMQGYGKHPRWSHSRILAKNFLSSNHVLLHYGHLLARKGTSLLRRFFGDVWTWTAICADTKLVPSWFVGLRDAACAYHFMTDLAGRLKNRLQLTTDSHRPYLTAVEGAFGSYIDYAQMVKIYGKPSESDTRYSPAECIGTVVNEVTGDPDPKHVSTSYVERQNLTMRMCMRRFTRLTNAFSKKVENHIHAVALHYMYYNFVRIHQTLRVTPAMEAGVANHAWTVNEIVEMSEAEIFEKAG